MDTVTGAVPMAPVVEWHTMKLQSVLDAFNPDLATVTGVTVIVPAKVSLVHTTAQASQEHTTAGQLAN